MKKVTLTTHEPGKTMMQCGHASNAKDAAGNPVCAICIGISPGAEQVAEAAPDLSGRKARCTYFPRGGHYECKGIVDSSLDLAFFEHLPDAEFDSYYCGCWGWN